MIKIKYSAENIKGEKVEYFLEDVFEARERAVNQIKTWKDLHLADPSYKGLKLSLSCFINNELTKTHFLLNGERMHTEDIIMALTEELSFLNGLGYEPQTGVVKFNDKDHEHVADDFITLYYFTAAKSI